MTDFVINRDCSVETATANIGLLFGNNVNKGISCANITATLTGTDAIGRTASLRVDDGGHVVLEFAFN